jgi:prevent-host-death family protein
MGTPAKQYSLSELQETLSDFLQDVSQGREVVLTSNNLPVAQIVPLPPTTPRRRALGDVPGIWLSPNFHQTPEEFNEYL